MHVGCFCLDCSQLKVQMREACEARAAALQTALKEYALRWCVAMRKRLDSFVQKVGRVPTSPEELYSFKQLVMGAAGMLVDMRAEMGEADQLFEMLVELQCDLADHEAHVRWELRELPQRMQSRLQRGKNLFHQARPARRRPACALAAPRAP